MNRREVPIDVWREKLLDKTKLVGNGVALTVVPDIGPGDTDFRLLPEAVFESCTRLVIDYYGSPEKRDVFSLFYRSKLEEHRAAIVNKSIHSAETDRKRIKESSGLSFAQEINFRQEIEYNTFQLLAVRTRVTERHEAIKEKVDKNPEFEGRLRECEEAYNELLVLAVKPENGDQPLDLLDAIGLVHDLIGRNISEYLLPPVSQEI